MSKKKRKGRKKKAPQPIPWPPAEEPIVDMIKRQALYRRAVEEFKKRNGITDDSLEELEAEQLPDTMSPREIDEELNELLDQDEND